MSAKGSRVRESPTKAIYFLTVTMSDQEIKPVYRIEIPTRLLLFGD
jgi:hypothetical protein